ncbi:MAG: hypothetical protein Q8N23_24445 [Archangium sp.]|nr:hypothetical protein [Archangium sp.]MDP3575446.1 hypothetical protein [Archangium sp.]
MTEQTPSWFSRNWKWVALAAMLPIGCCCSLSVVALLLPADGDFDGARVDCGTPGPSGVDCEVRRTSGTGALEACWDQTITCANQAVMVARKCGQLSADQSTATVNMPVSSFSNQEACDAPKAGAVVGLSVRTVE